MNNTPSDRELEILELLWQNGAQTVKEINEDLNKKKKTGYTTTLKFMQIMYEKGLLGRKEKGRSHIYFSLADEKKTKDGLIKKLLDKAFTGSPLKLVMQLLGSKTTSKEEISQIRELLKNLEK